VPLWQHCNNAWLTGSGVAPVDLVRTRPRRNQFSQRGPGGAKRLRLPQKLWQLRNVRRDPPRFARNAALRYVQEGVMEFATMYSNLLRDDN